MEGSRLLAEAFLNLPQGRQCYTENPFLQEVSFCDHKEGVAQLNSLEGECGPSLPHAGTFCKQPHRKIQLFCIVEIKTS